MRRAKSCQLSLATSTLKHSSNQKGLRSRKKNRSAIATAVIKSRVSTGTRFQRGAAAAASGGLPATPAAAIFESRMLLVEMNMRISNDTIGEPRTTSGFQGGDSA